MYVHQVAADVREMMRRCRVASQHLSFRVISLYAPKAEKLLDQEQLSIEWVEQQSAPQPCGVRAACVLDSHFLLLACVCTAAVPMLYPPRSSSSSSSGARKTAQETKASLNTPTFRILKRCSMMNPKFNSKLKGQPEPLPRGLGLRVYG